MTLNIAAVVEDLKNIRLENVIFEAIMNAIQANATKIKLKLYTNSLEKNDKILPIYKMEIVDNGDGFTKANLESFDSYRSDYKKSFGCKGVGRFVYLKIFNDIKIRSRDIEASFNLNGFMKKSIEENINDTKISFLNPKDNTLINIQTIAKNIKEHFLAYFKIEDRLIEIGIYNNDIKIETIKSTDIPHFRIKQFKIKNYDFKISYIFGDSKLGSECFYAANHRIVIKNSNLDNQQKFNLVRGIDLFFILESEYFDKNVNDERNELQIYPKQTNLLEFYDLNWEDIHEELEKEIKEICRENNFNISETINENRKRAVVSTPYLGAYFENREELNLKDMQKNATKEFNKDKEFLRDKNNIQNKNYEIILNRVTQAELAEYIFDRDRLIEKLEEYVKNHSIEKEIHNLFIKQNTSDSTNNYKTNNVWLFDDRFMSYDKIFSDKQIKEIFPKLNENLERPDILSIISNTYEKDKISDILLIEFKKPEANKEYFSKAAMQLLDYSSYVNQSFSNKNIRIWAYGFLEFSDEILRTILNDDYNQIYTKSKFPICYKYNKTNNVIINFMDYNALISDARNRNQVFLNILRGKYINESK